MRMKLKSSLQNEEIQREHELPALSLQAACQYRKQYRSTLASLFHVLNEWGEEVTLPF